MFPKQFIFSLRRIRRETIFARPPTCFSDQTATLLTCFMKNYTKHHDLTPSSPGAVKYSFLSILYSLVLVSSQRRSHPGGM